MAIRLSMILTANGRQALAETQALRQSFEATAGAGYRIGETAKVSGAELGKLTGKVNLATAKFTEFKSAQVNAAIAAQKMSGANQLAAGSLGNLTAQFNDIGVMLAAGQSPLQLALQQGTQITQVIGPLGATGAVRALVSAFLGMINPVSLITIGTIAAGAALFQYTRGALAAKNNTGEFEEALKSLGDQTLETQDKLALLRSGLKSIEELRVQNEITRLTQERADFAQRIAAQEGRGAAASQQTLDLMQQEIDAIDKKLAALKEAEAALAIEEQSQKRIQNAYRVYANTRLQSEAEIASALEQQYTIYGQTRAEAENLSQQLLEAYRAGGDFSGVDLEAGVDAAAAAAAALAENLGVSLQVAQGMVALGSSLAAPGGPDQARSNVRNTFSGIGGLREEDIISRRTTTGRRSSRGRGSGAGARSQSDALGRLTESLRDELAILRETDPIHREMIRNRGALTGASETQRTTIESLIREHQTETDALDRKRGAWDLLGQSASGVLDGIFDKSKSLGDVLRNLGTSLLDVAIQGQLLGTGPFGGGGGGLLGAVFPSLIPARAEGGPVFGPGGPKDDKVLMWGSNGEFMMNAAATARYRPLLELMNAGSPIAGFANGGPVGGGATRVTSSANTDRAPLQVSVDLAGARGDREIEEAAYRGMQQALQEYDRETLPIRMGQLNSEPRMRG